MYNKAEYGRIMSALVDKTISVKHKIEKADYACEGELASLEREVKGLEDLANKTVTFMDQDNTLTLGEYEYLTDLLKAREPQASDTEKEIIAAIIQRLEQQPLQ